MARPVVLVADGDQATRELLAQAIATALEVDILVARDGREALARAAERPPAVALVDAMMLGVDGLEVTRRLRAAPATATAYVLVMTAGGLTAETVRAAGGDALLPKPVERADLLVGVGAGLVGAVRPPAGSAGAAGVGRSRRPAPRRRDGRPAPRGRRRGGEVWSLRKLAVLPLERALARLAPGAAWDDPARRVDDRGAVIPVRRPTTGERDGSLYLRWNTPAEDQATLWRVERSPGARGAAACRPAEPAPGPRRPAERPPASTATTRPRGRGKSRPGAESPGAPGSPGAPPGEWRSPAG